MMNNFRERNTHAQYSIEYMQIFNIQKRFFEY